jgi:hypothetical protein
MRSVPENSQGEFSGTEEKVFMGVLGQRSCPKTPIKTFSRTDVYNIQRCFERFIDEGKYGN